MEGKDCLVMKNGRPAVDFVVAGCSFCKSCDLVDVESEATTKANQSAR